MIYNVVTGLRRSGTSLVMLVLRQSGVPILGFKYMIQLEKNDGKIIISGMPTDHIRKGNPTGYWEMGSITTSTGILEDYTDLGIDNDVIKIVCECYYFSEPSLINKTIVVMRNPKKVLTSMMKGYIIKEEELEFAVRKNIRDLKRTFDYLKHYKKPYLVVSYENLLENPEQNIKEMLSFIGRGDWEHGIKVIDTSLSRSKPVEIKVDGLEEWEQIHNYAINNQISKILD